MNFRNFYAPRMVCSAIRSKNSIEIPPGGEVHCLSRQVGKSAWWSAKVFMQMYFIRSQKEKNILEVSHRDTKTTSEAFK